MLDLYNRDDGRRLQKQVTLKKCRERLEMLARQRADIDETISELSDFCRKIEEILGTKDLGAREDEQPA